MRWREDFDLPGRFQGFLPPVVTQALVALALVLLAVGGRALVGLAFGNVVPFALLFPAIAVATLLAGSRSGLLVVLLGQLTTWYFVLPFHGSFRLAGPGDIASLVLSTFAELLLLWSVAGQRDALKIAIELEADRAAALESRLAALAAQAEADELYRRNEESLRETRQNLRAIYDASADGLALCRAMRAADGRVVDYQVIEVNRAHQTLCGATREQMLSRPVSQISPPVNPQWFESAHAAIGTMTMQQFDVRSPDTGRWLNIRVSPVSHDLFQQTFVDVTDRRLLEEQRGQMLMEMSHRVANNFQMVASFLRIQSLHAEPVAQASLRAAEGRVQVLARLHSLLAYTESHRDIDVGAYVAELCDQLRDVIDRPADIALTCACEPLLLPADKVVPIGFIVSELVTNAVKYAFPAPASGVIAVSLRSDGDAWALTVEDNGRGLIGGSENRTTTQATGGLGTRLIRTFVNQIGGALTVRYEPGLAFEIRFAP